MNWDKIYKKGAKYKQMPQDQLSDILAIAQEHLGRKPQTVLDLGAGRGELAIQLAKLGHQVSAADISQQALSLAYKSAQQQKVAKSINFINCNLESLNNCNIDGRFDIIFNKLTFAFIGDKETFLKNIKSLLVPNGVFVLITPVLQEGKKYTDKKIKNISVSQKETESLLTKVFGGFTATHKEPFEPEGLEITYIAQNQMNYFNTPL